MNNDHAEIIWDKPEVVDMCMGGEMVKYANPSEGFSLRGVRYKSYGYSKGIRGGERDGITWHSCRREDGAHSHSIWVSESRPGEFVEVMIPVEDIRNPCPRVLKW